jgi:hypothetical protein
MNKIPSLFQRNYDGDRLVRNEVVPGSEWVLAGEGVPTIKYDGTCCLVRDGQLFKRYDAKQGKQPPANFEPAQPAPDPVTGHWPGWVPVGDGPDDRWHREAWEEWTDGGDAEPQDGTYELVGPKIRGNPYGAEYHELLLHGDDVIGRACADEPEDIPPRDFAGLRAWFETHVVEGIVWHHPDGRMVKLKRRDFGLPWPAKRGEVAQ